MSREWAGTVLAGLLVACGGNTNDHAPHPETVTETVTAAGAGGSDGGASSDVVVGGAMSAGAGRSSLGDEQLVGRGFTFASSLCGLRAGGEPSGPAVGVSNLYVRRAAKAGLEIVTYTRSGGAPIIEVHPLERDGDRWLARDVASCAWLEGYEDFWTKSERGDWSLEFLPARGGDAIVVRVTAAFAEGDVSALASPDVTPPTLSTFAEAEPFRSLVDGYGSSDFSSYFVFSEPLARAGVVVRDRRGREVQISRYLETNDFVWGFVVTDELSSDARIGGEIEDLAGVEVELDEAYPGIDLEVVDGDFEEGVAYESSDLWIGEGAPTCGQSGAATSPERPTLPPIAGQKSFLLDVDGWGTCSVFFRVARLESSTQLRFTARRIALPEDNPEETPAYLMVCVSSLEEGDDRACSSISPTWVLDDANSTQGAQVSLPTEISVPLSSDAEDLWVGLETDRRLWLDSLHTE